MDSSCDAILGNQLYRRTTGKGVIYSPNTLRSSRSLEHRAPPDAQLRLFPDFRDENEGLLALQEQQEQDQHEQRQSSSWLNDDSMDRTETSRRDSNVSRRDSNISDGKNSDDASARLKPSTKVSPPTMERTSAAWYYSTQITGRDLLADLHHHNAKAKEAEQKHIIMSIL